MELVQLNYYMIEIKGEIRKFKSNASFEEVQDILNQNEELLENEEYPYPKLMRLFQEKGYIYEGDSMLGLI